MQVAFICVGNARWTKADHVPKYLGYKQGADRLVQLLILQLQGRSTGGKATTSTTTPEIEYVTVHGVSTKNWQDTSVELKDIFAAIEFTAQAFLRPLL
jgi:undecaprenyl pyrophosphate synthase